MATKRSVEDHMDDFNKLDLESIEVKIEDEDQALILLSSLPDTYIYGNFVDTLLNRR